MPPLRRSSDDHGSTTLRSVVAASRSEPSCAYVKAARALVTYDSLAEFAALSQRGVARTPRELLVLAQWPELITAFLLACQKAS